MPFLVQPIEAVSSEPAERFRSSHRVAEWPIGTHVDQAVSALPDAKRCGCRPSGVVDDGVSPHTQWRAAGREDRQKFPRRSFRSRFVSGSKRNRRVVTG